MLRHSCAYGRGMHAVCPSLIGMGTCSSSDYLDAHRRCGLLVVRSSASRYILFAHYRKGSAALWALGIGPMAEAYWQSARASSASVATANLGCPSALRPTLIGMKTHLFCALSPRLGGIMGARHRPYGRGILAVGPSLIANWFLVFLVIISMPIGVVANAHRHEGTYFLRIIAKARRHYGR